MKINGRGDSVRKVLDYIKAEECEVSVYFKQLNGDKFFEYKSQNRVPSASTIKILILAALFQKVIEGRVDLNNRIEVNEKDIVDGAGVIYILDKNNSYTILDLAKLMIILSDNTATNILIDLIGIEYINNYAKTIGLKNTELQRKMMDFEKRKMGLENLTTANDLGIILEKLYKHEILNENYCELAIDIMKNQILRGGIDRFLGEKYKIANKTGELNHLEHDCGFIFGEDEYVISILTMGKENYKLKEIIGHISKMLIEK